MAEGIVKWFSDKKGFGFIERDEGDDVFVHYTAIDGRGYRVLRDDQEVEFNVVQGRKGLEARNLSIVDNEEEKEVEEKEVQEKETEGEEVEEDKREEET